jgi:hypothetical protein
VRASPHRRRRPQTEAILHGYAEPGQQRAREAAETLPGRNGVVAMMPILGELSLETPLFDRTPGFPDVMMGTNEDQVIGVVEEMPDRLHFRRACRLLGAERIEADDHNAIDTVERDIERRHCARIVYALDLNDLAAR